MLFRALVTVFIFGMALAVPIQNSGSSAVSASAQLDSAESKTISQPTTRLANVPEADRNKRHLGFGGIGIGVGLFGGGFSPYDQYGYGGHYGGHDGYYGGYGGYGGGHFGGGFDGPYGYGGPHGFGSPYGFGGPYGPPFGGGYANGYHYGYGSGFSSGFYG